MKISSGIKAAVIGLMLVFSACSSGLEGGSEATLTIYGATASLANASESAYLVSESESEGIGSPSTLNVSLYAVYVSPNTDCSEAVLVEDHGDLPLSEDFASNPVLFTGAPADGTYECVIIEMEDVMTFTADADTVAANPACVDTATEHEFDIYRADSDEDPWLDIEGNAITSNGTPAEPQADIIFIFASTDPSAIPASVAVENQVITMTNPLTVPGSTTFVIDFTNRGTTLSEEGTDYCWLNPAEFSFE